MISGNVPLHEMAKIVTGVAPITPSTTTPDYVCMKGYARCSIIILADNATTVTGSAITVKQATAVAGTSEKAVEFEEMYANADTGATDVLVATAVTSDTFTTAAVDNKNMMYVIDIGLEDMDVAGGFDCIRVGTGDTTAQIVSALYVLYPAPYSRAANTLPTSITDASV